MLEDTLADHFSEPEMVSDDELLFDEADALLDVPDVFGSPWSSLAEQVHEGELLVGKYRVEHVPGRRGTDVLVDVTHVELASAMTLKYLAPDACSQDYMKRFLREARDASQIRGEHVARVMDVGRLDFGSPYLVRESLRGPDLAEVSKVRGPLPVAAAVDYVVQTCEGVAEAHAIGIVHRNLRPTTLVASRRPDGSPLVKVFDFAATEPIHVHPLTERAAALAGTSAVMSSLPYMAPEQIREPHDVDARADVYALGAILHELLSGEPIFKAENAAALVAAIVADVPGPLHELRHDVPAELNDVVLRCLAKTRAERYSSLASLALALRPFASADSEQSILRVLQLAKHLRPALMTPAPPRSRWIPTDDGLAAEKTHAEAQAVDAPGTPDVTAEASARAADAGDRQQRAGGRHAEQDEPSVVLPPQSVLPGGFTQSWPLPPPQAPRLSIWVMVAGCAALIAFVGAHQIRTLHVPARVEPALAQRSAPAAPPEPSPSAVSMPSINSAVALFPDSTPPLAAALVEPASALPLVAPGSAANALAPARRRPALQAPKRKPAHPARSGADLFSEPD